jgi:hypothetical protein
VTALTLAGYLTRVRIDSGFTLVMERVRETAVEIALKAGSPVLITIRKNAIRKIRQ